MYMCNVHSYIHVHACVGPKGTPSIFIVTKILKKKKKHPTQSQLLPNHIAKLEKSKCIYLYTRSSLKEERVHKTKFPK